MSQLTYLSFLLHVTLKHRTQSSAAMGCCGATVPSPLQRLFGDL